MSHTTNALANASSSYLRTAMQQPIRWHEWSEEAFTRAQQENKPILLDIGAVWCHWCHVMDRESYENAEVAKLVNDHFIAIKVDRDERPDIDSRYQAAVQAMAGQGGWPLTAFLTPDGRPFFGGTYFPREDHYGRPGIKRVLTGIAQAYRDKRDEVMESAESVMSAISHQESFAGRSAAINQDTAANIVEAAVRQFDSRHGGFGGAPKFPHPATVDLLIDEFGRTNRDDYRRIFEQTLQAMARGGVYDQLAGGFHRYSVDEKWIVPHFEKMSYDNAELLKNYVHAYQATENRFYADVARDIVRWIDDWLSDRQHGGFYASQDADYSLDDDGDYFTWTREEARDVLTPEEFAIASVYYDILEIGEMHHNPAKNVLWVSSSLSEIAAKSGKSEAEVTAACQSAKEKMYAARLQRPTPYIDKTMYVNWNAMMVSAYLTAARVLEFDEVQHFALKSLDRILAEGWRDDAKRLGHVLRYSGLTAVKGSLAGHLDDYAFAVLACLDAYETTGVLSYFRFAQSIADALLARFFDPQEGGFFDVDASSDPATLIGALQSRRKPFQDSPTPSGNSAAAIAMLRLHRYTGDDKYRKAAQRTLECFAGIADHFGMYAATYGIAVRMFTVPHSQVVVIGNDSIAKEMKGVLAKRFNFSTSSLCLGEGQAVAQNLPSGLSNSLPNLPEINRQRTVAVICADFACGPPVTSAAELEAALGR